MKREELSETMESYLSFSVGKELFAASVHNVLSILEMTRITEVPQAPEYMKGVINLRGEVIPIIDTKLKFGMPAINITKNTCILIMQISLDDELITVGVLVDQVNEVFQISDTEIKQPPKVGFSINQNYLKGIATVNDQFVMIIEVDAVFSAREIIHLQHEDVEASEA